MTLSRISQGRARGLDIRCMAGEFEDDETDRLFPFRVVKTRETEEGASIRPAVKVSSRMCVLFPIAHE